MYVAILMAAMLVTLLGVAGLLATRVSFRSATGAGQTIAARYYAESAIDLALLTISSDKNWVNNFAKDTWTAEQPIGEGTYTWKIKPVDGAAVTDKVARLYGKGLAGDAVRIYSVVVQEDEGADSNLLANPGMEAGVANWTGLGTCDLEPNADQPHSGSACMQVTNRVDVWDGPRQDITAQLDETKTYDMEAWVMMQNGAENVWIGVWARTEFGWYRLDAGTVNAGTEWTKITGTLTPSWSGTLEQAYWKLETASTNQDFMVDDTYFAEQTGPVDLTLVPVPGTWRRELVTP